MEALTPGPIRTHVPPASRLSLPAAKLPLTAFETMMWLDDRADYPMVFALECRVAGRFQPDRLAQAWDQVAAMNPLLSARLVMERGKPWWIAGPSGPPLVWMPADAKADSPAPIDMRTAPVCRCEVHESADETRLIFCCHHAASDGIGAVVLLGDLLAAYHCACHPDDDEAELREVDAPRLAERGRGPAAAPADPQAPPTPRWRKTWSMLRIAAGFAAAPVATLAPLGKAAAPLPAPGRRDASPTRPFVSLELAPEETERLRSVAAAAEATLNDVLLAAFFRTVAAWNAARGPLAERALCRLTMPVNLRLAQDKRMPTANVMSYAFLERKMSACREAGLLASLRDESRRVKESGRSVREFSAAIGLGAISPFAFSLGLRSVATFSTAVLSNLGDPTRRFASRVKRREGRVVAGDVTLLGIVGAPPVRPGTRASVAIFQNNGCLTFGLLTDPKQFARIESLSLLDAFAGELLAR